MGLEFKDADGDLVNTTLERDGDNHPIFSLDLRVGVGVLSLDTEKAKHLIGILSHYVETGELCDEENSAEQAATKFLNGLGDEIKGVVETVERLTERVAALEQAKEPKPEQQKYGLYGRPDGPEGICDYFQWHEESPFDSAGQAVAYAESHFMEDWRNRWRVYPYPEDGGKPVELRETPVTVSPGGTNYVYDQPKLPTLWGVWIDQDNRWAGSNMGEGSIAFFRSKAASEEYAYACGGEARPLPIEELVKDA